MADSLFGDLGLDEQTPNVLDFLGQEVPLAFRAEPALPTGGPVAGGAAPATIGGEGTVPAGEAGGGAGGGGARGARGGGGRRRAGHDRRRGHGAGRRGGRRRGGGTAAASRRGGRHVAPVDSQGAGGGERSDHPPVTLRVLRGPLPVVLRSERAHHDRAAGGRRFQRGRQHRPQSRVCRGL